MANSARIRVEFALLLISSALTWWLTRQAYQRELARRERRTARRMRTVLHALKDG